VGRLRAEDQAVRLDTITPVVLTYNEEPNIGRTLARLAWAPSVVVVDSGSTDRTPEILRQFANVRAFTRAFDTHTAQWTYAAQETGIATEWIMVLDADFVLAETFAEELAALEPGDGIAGYEARFRYCIGGRPLPRSLFPPRIVLCRRAHARFTQDGHTQRLDVAGGVGRLRSPIDHDDRKPLSHWIAAQDRYARLEREKLLASPAGSLGRADRIRRMPLVAPILVLLYCLFVKRLIFAGFPGWYYSYQRVVAELLLSLYMIETRLLKRDLQ
jgi:glycosyltransferase involved in cell wall biosynthesis